MSDEPHITQPDDDDPRLRHLLQAVERDAAPPDADRIEAIRRTVGDAFDSSAKPQAAKSTPVDEQQPEGRSMFNISRIVAVCLAGAAGFTLLFTSLFDTADTDVAFGEILERLEAADVLHVEVTRGGERAEVWIRQPGQVRWQDSPTRYQIASGSRLWRIDEEANTLAAEDSPWFRGAGQSLSVFEVLGLDDSHEAALSTKPVGIEEYDGSRCLTYRLDMPAGSDDLQLVAYADVESREFRGLILRDRDATRPPLAEMRLIAMDEPVDESLFVVAESLSEDGRIGKVLSAQGIVSLKPVMNRRWTPLARQLLVKPGDWVRTDRRGANASLVALTTPVLVTTGPASLVEFISPREIRLHHGVVQVNVADEMEEPFLLLGPGDAQVEITAEGKQIVRVARDETLATVAEPPIWLQGFEGTTNNESLGSLIVNIDETRNEPLTVGYHHASVEIRDQIARTTVEESFVNHTDVRLEGVFYFPLPQDASISGFGMWIGDELVEADVVEKQRAREIYETILREKRDPGLLEWTGGNIFKARVFPIEPNSEKRIKIVYTQVLPLRGNTYRYSYGLNSELLRTNPVRDLSLDVLAYSALPIASVDCPTHDVRSDTTAHSAHVEFTRQEYAPDRDFELVFELDQSQSDVVVIPHRRGDDGYFLLQLMPPSGDGRFQREVLPDGEPLDLTILCDTSASMDSTKREQQAEFVATLLASLGEADRFRLACCDVEAVWAVEDPVAATDETRAEAAAFLDHRISLGWTDLDRAFVAVESAAAAGSHVIYIGDGIVSTGEADPAAFVNRLRRLYDDSETGGFHAVTVGNSYESVALQGIASLGGGTMRAIGGEQTPSMIALELLNEIAQPGLTDINLEFRGLQVAAVYPESLPNLAAGRQQIVIGRYLPSGDNQQGEVIVTGRLGGEALRYVAPVTLKDAEAGNSFIPRLWARMHLDQLLQQGSSQFIRDEIIALSEEYHIITPYTSLLVLESDEDRERFGVKRRYQMRDGERFFAEGRDNATYELVQQQMRRAGDWRIGLRRQILAQLARLGRDPNVFQQVHPRLVERYRGISNKMLSESVRRAAGQDRFIYAGGVGGGGGYGLLPKAEVLSRQLSAAQQELSALEGFEMDFAERESRDWNGLGDRDESTSTEAWDDDPLGSIGFPGEPQMAGELNRSTAPSATFMRDDVQFFPIGPQDKRMSRQPLLEQYNSPMMAGWSPDGARLLASNAGYTSVSLWDTGASQPRGYYHDPTPDYLAWINQYFPPLPPAPTFDPGEPAEADWPAEVRAITDELYHHDDLLTLDGGVEVRMAIENRDPRWERITGHSESVQLFMPGAWLTRPTGAGPDVIVNWCDGEQRGTYSATFGLGRVRVSESVELTRETIGAGSHAQRPLHQSYSYTDAELVSHENNVAVLLLTNRNDDDYQWRLTIDTGKHVVLKSESLYEDEVTATTTYDNHVEVHGLWWPTEIVSLDAEGRMTSTTTQTVTGHTAEQLQARIVAELGGEAEDVVISRDETLFLGFPFVELDSAKQAVADGSAGFNEHLAVLLHFTLSQQWDEVRERLESIEQLAAGKPGLTWIQAAVWGNTRSNEDVRQLLLGEARELVDVNRQDAYALAERIRNVAYPITDWNEYGAIVQLLKPVYDRQPETRGAVLHWQRQWLQTLQSLGRSDEALALLREMAEATPWDIGLQSQYAQTLANRGDREAAYAWLDTQLARETPFLEWERDQVYQTYDQILRNAGEYERLVGVLDRWIQEEPASSDAYSRYLSALIFDDQVDRAKELVREWTADGRIDGKLADDVKAKLSAAVSFMLGQTYNIYWYRVDVEWLPLLEETADFHMRQPESFDVTEQIMGNGNFRDTDECDSLIRNSLALLNEQAATLPPGQISTMASWFFWGQVEVTEDDVRPIADALRERWADDAETMDRYSLGQALVTLYSNRFADSEYLPFLRARIDEGPAEYRTQYIQTLFDTLLGRNWDAELEEEAFALLPRLGETMSDKPLEPIAEDDFGAQSTLAQRLFQQVGALHRLVDRMLEARYQADLTELQDTGHPEELTRHALAEKQAEFRKAAREGVLERLGSTSALWTIELERRPAGAPDTVTHQILAEWARMEGLHLSIALNRDLAGVTAQCWTILGDAPLEIAGPEDAAASDEPLAGPVELSRELLDGLRRHRALVIVSNLAARRSADEALVTRVLTYITTGAERETDDAELWKQTLYAFLVALDRPDSLVMRLREWIARNEFTAPWRTSLGRLLAERGELEEAVRLFEAVDRNDELPPSDRLLLADWYQALDQRERYEQERVAVYKVMEEYRLQQYVQTHVYQWQNTEGPRGNYVEDDVLFALRALYEKSSSPGNYIFMARDLYKASRDFRVLRMLPDSVVGRTPQQVYSFFQNMRYLLAEIRKEATSDEVLARIAEVRARDRAQSAIDLRALDLLEALVERQASEVLNQPGPHVEAALAALRRAFDREWAEGEPRQMAEFLAGLGRITPTELSEEQLRELQLLADASDAATDDGLWIRYRLCEALYNSYGQHDEAITWMTSAVRDYEQAHPDGWPAHANDPLKGHIGFLNGRRRYSTGEALLKRYHESPLNDGQRHWMAERLDELYLHALVHNGQVSLGTGETLYANLRDRVIEECSTPDQNHRANLISRLVEVFRRAKEKQYPSVNDDLVQFAFRTLPELLAVQTTSYANIIQNVGRALRDLVSPRTGIRFLIVRIEQYPDRLDFTWENAWQQFGNYLAQWRAEIQQPLGNLEPRLLKIVLDELRRDLLQRESRNRTMYHDDYQHYWGAYAADYLRVAEEVYEQRRHSGRSVKYIAEYLWHGLPQRHRAIEIMFVALGDEILDENGRQQLVTYLFLETRHAEAIPILEKLVEVRPDSMSYRTQLMLAYFHSRRPAQLEALLAATDEHFRQAGRWVESDIATLAQTCVQCRLHADAVRYYGELIPLHQRTQPNQGIGGGTLSEYYRQLAIAHSKLGNTTEAVDAAAGAIIAWGPDHEQRGAALHTLDQVLRDADDLDEYVASLDAEADETGQDSPVLRKAIGLLYSSRNNFAEGARHLEIALELQPGDPAIYAGLITCYDKLERTDDAVELLLTQIDLNSHDLGLYQQLLDRFTDDPMQAERAATSIVEASPLEAENHQKLAEIRTGQTRHDEAVAHWRRVADLRSLEPNGLLGLAAAQLDAGDVPAARRTMREIRETEWPSRFENEVTNRLSQLNQRITNDGSGF